MKKIKRFFRSACEPIPLWALALLALLLPILLAAAIALDPSAYSDPELLEYLFNSDTFSPDVMVSILGFSGVVLGVSYAVLSLFFVGCMYALFRLIKKRRKGAATVKDNWIMVHVDDDTYDRLHQMSADCKLSTSRFCAAVLEAIQDGDLEDVFYEEADHG